jgi:hypothetical protein
MNGVTFVYEHHTSISPLLADFFLDMRCKKILNVINGISFIKWREMAADRNQWRAICGSKTLSATKETPSSSRQDIWAKLQYSTVPS